MCSLYIRDIQAIEKTWVLGTKAPRGPFTITDVIGLTTVYNIILEYAKQTNDDVLMKGAILIKKNFIDQGKLGVETGEGFYSYPNPAYMEKTFISNQKK